METTNLLEEDNDVTFDDLKKFIEQAQEQQDKLEEENQEIADKSEEDRISVHPSTLYQAPARKNFYENMIVPVRDDQHVITNSDKEAYLQAMLTDSQLELPIEMQNGITIVCRDLNMYERELSMELVKDQIKENNLSPVMLAHIMRGIRMPMQLVRVNDKKFDTIKFEFKDYTLEQLEQDKKTLSEKQKKLVMPMSVGIQSLYLKALNIFEHKLARLEEAAFNKDFWNPADHD